MAKKPVGKKRVAKKAAKKVLDLPVKSVKGGVADSVKGGYTSIKLAYKA
jgi:hypothetical protein